jgi:hypothetical protein
MHFFADPMMTEMMYYKIGIDDLLINLVEAGFMIF